jgi:hypothetical protein
MKSSASAGSAEPIVRRVASITSNRPSSPTTVSIDVSCPARLPSDWPPSHRPSNSGSVCTTTNVQQAMASRASSKSNARSHR